MGDGSYGKWIVIFNSKKERKKELGWKDCQTDCGRLLIDCHRGCSFDET